MFVDDRARIGEYGDDNVEDDVGKSMVGEGEWGEVVDVIAVVQDVPGVVRADGEIDVVIKVVAADDVNDDMVNIAVVVAVSRTDE